MIRPISVIIAAVLLLGPLLGLELGLRVLTDAGRLPFAASSNALTDVSLTNLARLGRPDVLVLGSSASRAGVKPPTLERRIRETTGGSVRVQNVGQPALTLESQRLLVRELSAMDLLPSVVLTGITPVTLMGDFGGQADWFRAGELGQVLTACADLDLSAEWFDCQLARGSSVWRWRGRPGRIITAITEGMPSTVHEDARVLHENGWLEIGSASRFQLARRTERALDAVPVDPTAPQDVVDAFAALIAELRSHDLTVIAFELPYEAAFVEALEERHPGWSVGIEEGYVRFEEAAGIEIVAVEGYGGWVRPQSFRDPRHLSGEGAGPFTRQLWNADGLREPLLEGLGLEVTTVAEEPA